jgi:hypothetical protein
MPDPLGTLYRTAPFPLAPGAPDPSEMICALRDDLEAMREQVGRAIGHFDALLASPDGGPGVDVARSVLHLRARLEAMARQIADTRLTVDRLVDRPGCLAADEEARPYG